MLITQPAVMWTHGRFWLLAHTFCCWLSLLFPKVFFLALLTWGLYAFVVLVESGFHHPVARAVLEIFMGLLYLLTIYTYFKVIMVGPGSPLDFPELHRSTVSENPYADLVGSPRLNTDGTSADDAHELEISGLDPGIIAHRDLSEEESSSRDTARLLSSSSSTSFRPPSEYFTSHTFKNNAPAYKWCSLCQVWKPDRCHHCSSCNRCFLRMDHHCPWFACCIGFYNQKFFVQVLIYVTVFCLVALAVSFLILFQFFVDEQWDNNHYLLLNLVFLFVISLAFSVAMIFFTGFSIYMVFRNTTTIEFQDTRWGYLDQSSGQYEFDNKGKKQRLGHIYDLGWRKNWASTMGNSWVGWVFPTTTTTRSLTAGKNNGVNFEINTELYEKYCQNAQLQEQLNQQLAEYRDRIRGTR